LGSFTSDKKWKENKMLVFKLLGQSEEDLFCLINLFKIKVLYHENYIQEKKNYFLNLTSAFS